MTNKNKPPTKQDRRILEFLENGGIVNFMIAYQSFGSSRLSDNLYRLRNAGHVIPDGVPVYYTNSLGETKHYFNLSMVKPEIKAAGQKVETPYVKGIKNAADYANSIIEKTKKSEVLQPTLF